MKGLLIFAGGAASAIGAMELGLGNIGRRRDVAYYADRYGCFSESSVPSLEQRVEMKKKVWEYYQSWTQQILTDPPYNLMQVFTGIDFCDDPPGDCTCANRFAELNYDIIQDVDSVVDNND